ncbi:MAG: type II toxin-antitoxin system VapC family toxin [Trueperaceae bacterium]|nr:MAG: type II toxin-antitoxin system VapC family toxin [Trueperaceae bacterium]
MVVADTHAWLWWLSGDASLSSAARSALERAFGDGELGVSAISVWEAAMLVKKGRLTLALPLDELVARCETLPGLRFLPVTPRIAFASVALEPLHADPADRMIAATALAHQAVLVTKDERLHGQTELTCCW